jgi:hypothetical protein
MPSFPPATSIATLRRKSAIASAASLICQSFHSIGSAAMSTCFGDGRDNSYSHLRDCGSAGFRREVLAFHFHFNRPNRATNAQYDWLWIACRSLARILIAGKRVTIWRFTGHTSRLERFGYASRYSCLWCCAIRGSSTKIHRLTIKNRQPSSIPVSRAPRRMELRGQPEQIAHQR